MEELLQRSAASADSAEEPALMIAMSNLELIWRGSEFEFEAPSSATPALKFSMTYWFMRVTYHHLLTQIATHGRLLGSGANELRIEAGSERNTNLPKAQSHI